VVVVVVVVVDLSCLGSFGCNLGEIAETFPPSFDILEFESNCYHSNSDHWKIRTSTDFLTIQE